MTNEVPAGLSPDAELRYRMVAHVLNTRHVYPDAVEAVVEDLIRYVKRGPKAATGFASGYVSSPFCSPSDFASGTFGQTDKLRNGEHQRG
jgi:hypothetical protein